MSYWHRSTRNGHDYADASGERLFPKISPLGDLAYQRHSDGHLILERYGSDAIDLGPTYGNSACCWSDDGRLFWLADASGLVQILSPDGTRGTFDLNPIYQGYLPAAEGLHSVTPNGQPVIANDPAIAHAWVNGIELWALHYDADGSLVALGSGGGPAGCVVKFNSAHTVAEMWVPQTDIQIPPRISRGRVAISGMDTPAPDDIVWQPFQLYVPPVPADPVVTLPQLPPDMPAIYIGGTNDRGMVAGNCAWSAGPTIDDRPVMGGSSERADLEQAERDILMIEWSTEAASGGIPDLTDKCIPWAKATGAPIYLHRDSEDQDGRFVDAVDACDSVGIIGGAHAASTVDALDIAVEAVRRMTPKWGITINCRVGTAGLDALYRRVERAVLLARMTTARTTTGCCVLWFTDIDRANTVLRTYYFNLVQLVSAPDRAKLLPQTIIQKPQPPASPGHAKPGPTPVQTPKISKHSRWKFWK